MPPGADLKRLQREYHERDILLAHSQRYSVLNPAHLFVVQQYMRHVVDCLRQNNITSLSGKRVLEVGCGSGGVLLDWLRLGIDAQDLHGVDLLPNRLGQAQKKLAHLPLLCADGQFLPYHAGSFDIVIQFTALSSILDRSVQKRLAQEMVRVVKRGGTILSYDFWLNPTNKQTRGLRPHHLRALFPDCDLHLCRVTLAPPLARRLVPLSWTLALLLEKLKIFNTHYLALIQPKSSPD